MKIASDTTVTNRTGRRPVGTRQFLI